MFHNSSKTKMAAEESESEKESTKRLLNAKTFSIDSTASYGSVNSAHYENIKPGLRSPWFHEDGSNRVTSQLKKFIFGRVDSVVEPRFEDKHLITCQDKTNCQLVLFSLKHALTLFLVTLPTILIACLFTIGYSKLPWSNPSCQMNATEPCLHYKKEYFVYFDVYARMVLLSTIAVLVTGIALNGGQHLVKYLLYISVPLITIATASIPGLLKYSGTILYYYIDVLMCAFILLSGVAFSIMAMSRNLEIQITLRRLMLVFLFPSVLAALGISFLDVFVNKEYQTLSTGSIGQYVIRLLVYPVIVDIVLGITEANIRKIPTNHINNTSHVIYFYQVSFTIIGRYMTTVSGCLVDIFVMAASITVKDFLLHRMSRARCWIAFQIRWCLRKTCPRFSDTIDYDNFEEWFFSKDFTYFKANTLNNEFSIELTGVVVVPVVMASFQKHSMLYYFKDQSFRTQSGALDYSYMLQQEAVQVLFLFITIVMVTYMEARYNRVNISAVIPKYSFMQYVSQTLIYIWAIILFLSSVRTTPNYFQCTEMNICKCQMEIPLARFSC